MGEKQNVFSLIKANFCRTNTDFEKCQGFQGKC